MELHIHKSGLLKLSEIIPLVESGSVIFLDLDDTLVVENLMTGKRERVEDGVLEVLEEIRKRGGLVVACTARTFSSLERIEKHLEEASINLNDRNLDFIEPFFMNEARTAGYARGIMCCPHFATQAEDVFRKPDGILHFIEMLENKYCCQVSGLIFVDDAESLVKMVHKRLSSTERKTWCFQYRAGQDKSAEMVKENDGYQDVHFERADFITPKNDGFWEMLMNTFI